MQPPTCIKTIVRTTREARTIFHAVASGLLPMVSRRLDMEERRAISPGSVYVWEEKTPFPEQCTRRNQCSTIERWTDSIQWGPSRVREEFLYYNQKDSSFTEMKVIGPSPGSAMYRHQPSFGKGVLIKQTFSVFVTTPYGRKKWHLIAYFTEDSQESLYSVHKHPNYPHLATLRVPLHRYPSARSGRSSRPLAAPAVYSPSNQRRKSSCSSSERTLPSSPGSSTTFAREVLAPLEILQQCVPPPPRHPMDERAIMSFPLYEFFIRQGS